jgi:hypothetical protein
VFHGGSRLGDMIVPGPDKEKRLSGQRENCWSCGMLVLIRADLSYACHHCDVRLDPLADPELRAGSQARELQAHMRKYGIDGWLDHGDPSQRRPAPALTRSPGARRPN